MIETKNHKKAILDEFISRIKSISQVRDNRLYQITEENLVFITEVVKGLYNSEVIQTEIPDGYDHLKHILENQVYGLAPTEIIYKIAISFIFSELTEGISQKNFAQLDAHPYAEDGTLEEKLDEVVD